jgi:hypothetical protein
MPLPAMPVVFLVGAIEDAAGTMSDAPLSETASPRAERQDAFGRDARRYRRVTPALRIDRFELAVLAAFTAVSIWVLALVIAQAIRRGRTWTGTDGIGLQDQMQYLAWIQDSARHVLVSNLFVLSPTSHHYLQPLVAVSGLLTAIGVPAWLTLLMWKPVAVGGVFFALRAYVHHTVSGSERRLAALILALFFVGPGRLVATAIRHLGLSGHVDFPWHDVTLDPWIGWWSWGYPFGLIGLAAMVTAVLLYDREREGAHAVGLSPFLGALASWVHPWQGATLIAILVGSEIGAFARTRQRVHPRQLLVTTVATALPLVYYAVLARTDSAWKLSQAASGGSWPLWALALCELPLALPALVAFAARPLSFLGWATRVWPIAALVVYALSQATSGGFALHAFLGINVPLAVMAVEGWGIVSKRLTWLCLPGLAGLVVAVLVLPAFVDQLRWASESVSASAQAPPPRGHGDAKFVTGSERLALDYLGDLRGGGGVLTRGYLGTVVPGMTGRQTYVGNSYWSPGFSFRAATADDLFLGRMSANAARAFVRSTGARFILVDCSSREGLRLALAPLIAAVHGFGCASVYVLR